MIVNEKALVKAMEKAAGEGGYRVRFNEDEGTIVICTKDWLVNMNTSAVPRKVLGVFAEHFGYVPRSGCFTVFKEKKAMEATVQAYQNEVFSADVVHLCYGTRARAAFLPVTAWGWTFAQNECGELYASRPDNHDLALSYSMETVDGKALSWYDDDSAVFVEAVTSTAFDEPKHGIVTALSGIDWHLDMSQAQTAADGDENEQMEIGDDEEPDDGGERDE